MNPPALHQVLRQLRQRLATAESPGPSDGQLLHRFARLHEEAAFEALLGRHGPMVWGVCRRLLPEGQAEDAFQATFLVLLQKAASIREHDSTASWLYGVARRIARRARANADRREWVERQAPLSGQQPDVPSGAAAREVVAIVEEELARLPERLRAPLMLCGLGGLSKAEAARQLGCKTGTLASRLARARERLRGRLARRGVVVPAAAVGGLLTEGVAQAAVPARLVTATARTAAVFLAGGRQSAAVAMLAKGAAAGAAARLKVVAALLLGLTILAAGAGLTTHGTLAAGDEAAPRREPVAAPRGGGAPVPADAFGDPLPPGALARMGTVRLRQAVSQLTFAPDGKTLITSGADHRVSTWDVGTGQYLQGWRIEGTQGFDRSATNLAPDGKAVLVWLWERQSLLVCEVPAGKKLGSVSMRSGRPYRAALAPGGKTVAVAVNDGHMNSVRVWDVGSGNERQLVERKSAAEALAFSPDGKLLAAGGGLAEELRVWDVATGALLHRVPGRRTDHGLTFSPDGKTLAAWCDDRKVRLWDMTTGREQAALPATLSFCLAFSPDGKLLAAGGQKGVGLWDLAAGKEPRQLPSGRAWALAFAPDGKTLAVNCGNVQLWDVASGKQLLTSIARAGHGEAVDSLAVSPDGKILASACYGEGTLCLWDSATGRLLHRIPKHNIACRFNCFTPDGKLVASGGHDGLLHLWETATGKEWRGFPIEQLDSDSSTVFVDALALAPDGKRLFALTRGGERERRQINVWDTASGKLLKRRRFEGAFFSSFTPDGKGIMLRTDKGLTIQDTFTGQELVTIPATVSHPPIAFSPDGSLVATGHSSAPPTTTMKAGRVLVQTAHRATAVRVAELATGKEVCHSQTGPVHLLAFSPDGRVLAASDGDVVRLWETATGKEMFRQPRHGSLPGVPAQAAVTSLAFLSGGRHLATGLSNGTVLVWALTPADAPARDLRTLWADLAEADAGKAYRAIHGLSAAPAQAVALLKAQLKPVPEVEPRRVQRLLGELDSNEFAVREAAAKELAGLGERVGPALRRALMESPSAEVRRRVKALLAALAGVPEGDTLREIRAIWVLDWIGTTEARLLLQALVKGAPAARQTVEARAALRRLGLAVSQ